MRLSPLGVSALARFDTRRLAVAILFVGLFAMAVRAPTDTDLWWHLQAGRVTLESGHPLQTDLFSHTRQRAPWVNHSWLSQVLLYGLLDRFSYAGLALWMGAVVTATFVLIYAQMEADPFSRAFILILAASTSSVIWTARPQLLSFLLIAVVAYVLYLLKWRGKNRLWLLPPIFVLWVNLHAGYALGFLLIGCFLAGELLNHLLAKAIPAEDPVVGWGQLGMVLGVALLSGLLLVLNPNATRMWTYPWETLRIGVLQDLIQEWQSPDFHPLYTQPFIWMLLALLGAVGLSGRRIDGTDLVTVGAFAYAALLAGRNLGPFAIVAAPVLSRHVAAVLERLGGVPALRSLVRRQTEFGPRLQAVFGAVNVLILALVVALAAWKVSLPLHGAYNEQVQRGSLPVGAVDWIERERPEGRMFNRYRWGGYLVWRLWPEHQVFVDGRTDLYGDKVLGDYVEIETARPRAMELLEEYGVSWAIVRPEGPLATLLECEGWEPAYRDDLAVVWLRDLPGS